MRYYSTRNKSVTVTGAQAIKQGLAADGGLFVPETIPTVSLEDISAFAGLSYRELAAKIMGLYLDDYSYGELKSFCDNAYCVPNFSHEAIAPVTTLSDGTSYLELWHGPTCAFKDMALQMLPHLLSASLDKCGEKRNVCILVATSGDTGKAALEGFADVPRTKIIVFYPRDGVSAVQKLQMVSQKGENVFVSAVAGNFDDAQSGVKRIFSDAKLAGELSGDGWQLSSANSINWGRLLPQIVYYFSAYCALVSAGTVKLGEKIDFCVPTGNFGDILAGWYAREMGLPVRRLVCASNRNDVLTEFLSTGVYNRNRPFFTTASPSMDILISSNLERLIFHLSARDDEATADYMAQLSSKGQYEVSNDILTAIKEIFSCGSCDDVKTGEEIRRVFDGYNYLMDTHTAVASKVAADYVSACDEKVPMVVVSTASPYKFCGSVLDALGAPSDDDGPELIAKLEQLSSTVAPEPLRLLRGKTARFDGCVEPADMTGLVREFIAK